MKKILKSSSLVCFLFLINSFSYCILEEVQGANSAITTASLFESPEISSSFSCLKSEHYDQVSICTQSPFLKKSLEFKVTTGSLLGFSDYGLIGKTIKTCSIDTHNGFSHVGIAIVAYPLEILRIILESINQGGLATRKKKYQIYQQKALLDYFPYLKNLDMPSFPQEKLEIFCFESTGAADEVVKGLKPRVKINLLSKVAASYKGDVCIRPLIKPIPLSALQHLLVKELGVSYEKKLLQLLGATKNRNKHEDSSSWFCSELVAHIYKTYKIIENPIILANNVTPQQFSSWYDTDLIQGRAESEQYIKEYKKECKKYKKIKKQIKNKITAYKTGKYLPFSIQETA